MLHEVTDEFEDEILKTKTTPSSKESGVDLFIYNILQD